jgi:hypothetical protein
MNNTAVATVFFASLLCPGALHIRAAAPQSGAARLTPASPPLCNREPHCVEANAFAATITDFRASTRGNTRLVTATLRFYNKLSRPIILGYLAGAGVALDDRGNRFRMNESTGIQGIGLIHPNQLDPKFVLAPRQTSDARLEYAWAPRAGEIFGLTYDLEFTIREILPVSPTQFRLGLEHPLKFHALTDTAVSAAPAPAPTPAPQPHETVPTPPVADPCANIPRCYSAGPFTAQIQHLTASMVSYHQVLRLNIRFRNLSPQPIVLAYKNNTAVAIDNHGQRLNQSRQPVTGISIWSDAAASVAADFQIAPGEHRDATFELTRYAARTLTGTGFSLDFAVQQLEILPANQVRAVREYTLNFTGLTAATPAPGAAPPAAQGVNESLRSLKDIFNRRKK